MRAKEDLGDAQANDLPSRRRRLLTVQDRSDTGACCPGAYQQAGPPARQHKKPHGRRSGCLLNQHPTLRHHHLFSRSRFHPLPLDILAPPVDAPHAVSDRRL